MNIFTWRSSILYWFTCAMISRVNPGKWCVFMLTDDYGNLVEVTDGWGIENLYQDTPAYYYSHAW